MSNNLLSLVGWMFLPGLVTSWIQSIYYGLTIRAGDPKPGPGSPKFIQHRRRIHILVVSLYLAYTIYEADFELRKASNFYTDLGVPVSAGDKDIKTRFRRLAALHHPDKQTSNNGDNGDLFIQLKTASDTLTDAAKRFAYERFGPEIVEWKKCITIKDFVNRGVQNLVPYYGMAAIVMYVLSLFGYLEWGKYWRWVSLVALCVFELHTVTRPGFPQFVSQGLNPLLTRFTTHPPYLPFQIIAMARKCSVTMYIAFSQIGPLLQPQGQRAAAPEVATEKAVQQGLDRLQQTAKAVDNDTVRLMDLEMAPFAGDPALVSSVRGKVKEWLVQNTIRSDPMVRDALGRELKKRRMDAPAGAKGNR